MSIVVKEHRPNLVTGDKTLATAAHHFDTSHNFDKLIISNYGSFHKLEPKKYSQSVVGLSANLQIKKHIPIPEVFQLLCNVL